MTSKNECLVLVAEDIPSNAVLTLEVLALAGCTAELVENGYQAVIACKRQRFDVILMDVHMPEMNGIDAIAAIREWEGETGARPHYIVIVTASAMPDDLASCVEAGADRIMTKPISIEELLTVVKAACDC